jgi:hypothetical protein
MILVCSDVPARVVIPNMSTSPMPFRAEEEPKVVNGYRQARPARLHEFAAEGTSDG